jgi:hypothetical protein
MSVDGNNLDVCSYQPAPDCQNPHTSLSLPPSIPKTLCPQQMILNKSQLELNVRIWPLPQKKEQSTSSSEKMKPGLKVI